MRQVFQQVGDLQRRTAGVERQALGDPQRHAAGGAVAEQLHLDAVGIAADAGFVDAAEEIAPLRRRAGGHRLQRGVVVVKQVQQALAGMIVVLQPLIEVRLLEHDAVVDAGHLIAVSGSAPARTLR